MSIFDPMSPTYRDVIGPWWEAEGPECARRIHATVSLLRQEQRYISNRYRRAHEMYENLPRNSEVATVDAAWQFSSWDTENNDGIGPYTLNLAESITDTVHAETITNRTRVQFISTGGDWNAQRKAVKLTRFTAGLFDEVDMHDKISPEMCLDALMLGDGFGKVFMGDDDRIKMCRRHPNNMCFDDVEAASGQVSSWFEEDYPSRLTFARDYEGNEEAHKVIMQASEFVFPTRPRRAVGDIIRVIEAWKPAYKNANGRHVICTENGIIFDEEWKHDYYPFIHLVYKKRPRSILGKGIPEILTGHQEIVNAYREKINAQLAGASPFLWTKPSARLRESQISNEIWRTIESEEMPQHISFAAVPPDLFQQQAIEQADAAAMIGVNQLMMKGEIPPGIVGNGRALRVYNDTKSKRFMRFARNYEKMHLDAASMMIDLLDDGGDAARGYKINYEDGNQLDELDFKDIRLPKTSFRIRRFPTNLLQDSASGRLSDIESLASTFPEMRVSLARALENPDVEAFTSQLSIQESAVRRIAEKLLDTDMEAGECPPVPEMNLAQAISIMKDYITDASSKGVPDDKVQKLRDWNKTAVILDKSAAPPPQVPVSMQPPPGDMMAAPTPDMAPPQMPMV